MSTSSLEAESLIKAVSARRDDLVDLTRALIRERSVLGQEAGVQRLIEQRLQAIGFKTERVTPDAQAALADPEAGAPYLSYDDRFSVVGTLPGSAGPAGSGANAMHLSGHVDVVPVERPDLWAYEPWAGDLADGRIYGRGAGDMKGGVAAYLIAAQAVVEICDRRRGGLIFSTVIEEECTGNGMWSVIRAGHVGDAVLIGESTSLRFAHAGTGVVWCRLIAPGGTGHSMLSTGCGPFELLADAVAALRVVEDEVNADVADPDFAAVRARPYGMSVGKLEGGVWTASTPHELTAHVRFGFGPETSPAEIQERLRAAVAVCSPAVRIDFEGFRAEAHNHPKSGPLVDLLDAAHRQVLDGPLEPLTNTATDDSRYVKNVPGLCYGGTAGNIHGTDEWVDVDSLVHAATVVALATASWTA